MKAPDCLEFSGQKIEALIERLEEETLRKEDYPLLVDLIKAIIWMNLSSLQEKNLSIKRLRSIFGIKTETAERLMSLARRKEKPPKKKEKKNLYENILFLKFSNKLRSLKC